MTLAVSLGSVPLRNYGCGIPDIDVQPIYDQFTELTLRRLPLRQNIPRKGYPVGHTGKLGNYSFVVLGNDDPRKLPPITEKTHDSECQQNDDDDEDDKQKTQENKVADEHFPSNVWNDMSESVGPQSEIWQQSACAWDRKQARHNQFRSYEVQRNREKPLNVNEIPSKAKIDASKIDYWQRNCYKDPLTGKEVRFTKPMVGFGGYIPRYPVLPRPAEVCSHPGLTSISRTTYKLYPSYEYRKQEFAHKGPLSSTVTLTPPFNPYNKIDKLSLDGKKLLWRRPNQATKIKKIRP